MGRLERSLGNQETRQHAEQLNQATRQDLTQQIAESRQHAEQLNTQTRQDLHRRIDETHQRIDDTTRETRVLLEDMRHQIQLLAEVVTTVRDQLGCIIADHEERITRLERRIP